jgi:uncharacterized protein (TIGR01777 family)
MRILIAGGSGFLGTHLSNALVAGGHQVMVLTRQTDRPARPGVTFVTWNAMDPASALVPTVSASDAVVNLAGESIAAGRWTAARKTRLRNSRVDTTTKLVEACRQAPKAPRTWVNGSAIGYYGSRGSERLTEESAPGNDFLARLAEDWEEAAEGAAAFARVVYIRTGIVLDRHHGALAKLILPFKLFVGGPVGSGEQYMSWIHRDDWVSMARWTLMSGVSGPFNATSPQPVTNKEFSRALGRALSRPSVLPAPAFAMRLLLGEMADALLLSSQRVYPERAQMQDFTFDHPDLDEALRSILS